MKQKIITILLAIVAILGGGYTAANLGSVQDGQAYNATSTSWFGTGAGYKQQLIKTGQGEIGTVNVTLTSNANMYLCDATTTSSQMARAFSTSTQCAISYKTTPAGSWTYDIAFTRGLLFISDTSVGLASSTVTFR